MKVGIPGLGLAVAEPMAVDAISFQQGGKPGLPSPVTIRWLHLSFLSLLWHPLSIFGKVAGQKNWKCLKCSGRRSPMFWSRDSQPSTRITLTQIRYHSKNPRSTITVRFQERILTNVYNSESTIILEMWVYYNSAIWRCLILRVSVKWPLLNAQFLAE